MKSQKERIVKIGNREIVVKTDPSLNKYSDIVLFPESLARCNENIAKYGLPDEYYKDQERLAKLKKDNS